MISFFNDFDMACREPWAPAMQFLGARGFFSDYDADPDAPLDPITARTWAQRAPRVALSCLIGLTRGKAAELIFHSLSSSSKPADSPAAPVVPEGERQSCAVRLKPSG